MQFKIPKEVGQKIKKPTLALVYEYIKQGTQMPYKTELVEPGLYRKWMSLQKDEDFERFIKHNETILEKALAQKVMAPNWKEYEYLVYRNCLYMTEQFLRTSDDTARLDEDLFSYYELWRGRFAVAYGKWQELYENANNIPEPNHLNPYY